VASLCVREVLREQLGRAATRLRARPQRAPARATSTARPRGRCSAPAGTSRAGLARLTQERPLSLLTCGAGAAAAAAAAAAAPAGAPLALTANMSDWLLVGQSQVTLDGSTCNTAGVGFAAFRSQPARGPPPPAPRSRAAGGARARTDAQAPRPAWQQCVRQS